MWHVLTVTLARWPTRSDLLNEAETSDYVTPDETGYERGVAETEASRLG